MKSRAFVRALISLFLLVAMFAQGEKAFAGTTGGLSGTVVDSATGKALPNVKITAASPSQVASVTSDGGGHFQFLNLAPDTYTVSAELTGYQPVSLSGVTVVADSTRVIPLSVQKEAVPISGGDDYERSVAPR